MVWIEGFWLIIFLWNLNYVIGNEGKGVKVIDFDICLFFVVCNEYM